MAVDALEACGVTDYHMEIGHVGYFSGTAFKALRAEDETQAALRQLVEKKDFVAYRERLKPYRDTEAGKALWNLPRMFGGPQVLEQAKQLTGG